jgi:predicted esterase
MAWQHCPGLRMIVSALRADPSQTPHPLHHSKIGRLDFHGQPTESSKPVLIVSGARDPIIRPESAAKLASLLERYDDAVAQRILPGGHELSQPDVTVAQSWWNKHVPATSGD